MTKPFMAAFLILAGSGSCADAWACSASNPNCAFSPAAYLDAHDKHRARHCVPALTWDPKLAAQAQAWANGCAFKHAPNGATGGAGENLYYTRPEMKAVNSGVDSWYAEAPHYDYRSTRYVPAAGHFTQVIWKGTTRLGCAVKFCPELERGVAFMVCRYAPAGNTSFNGKWGGSDNVPPVCR
jgi:uncharacterized protein YkwD